MKKIMFIAFLLTGSVTAMEPDPEMPWSISMDEISEEKYVLYSGLFLSIEPDEKYEYFTHLNRQEKHNLFFASFDFLIDEEKMNLFSMIRPQDDQKILVDSLTRDRQRDLFRACGNSTAMKMDLLRMLKPD